MGTVLESFRPDIIVPRLESLDQEELARRGIRGVILDLDNTVCCWDSREPQPACSLWIGQARARFGLCILSNTIKGRRLRTVGEALGLPTLGRWGLGRKPLAGGFRAALRLLGTTPGETAMVGDQLLADILGANRLGLTSVWVMPLSRTEFATTKVMRRLERRIARRLGLELPAAAPEAPAEGHTP